jgi:Glycosyl-4,4'-diaponeurosporenoate acyltransferase
MCRRTVDDKILHMDGAARQLTQRAMADRANAAMWVIIGATWFAPMLAFWYQAWDVQKPFATLSYLLMSGLSFVAVRWPASWFQPRAFEFSERFYEAVGVRRFRAHMVHGDMMNSRIRRTVPGHRCLAGLESMRAFGINTCAYERGNLLMLLPALSATAYAFLSGSLKFALYFVIVNVGLNVYPNLLQRYTRARITRIMSARENEW